MVALWLLMNDHNEKSEEAEEQAEEKVLVFVHECLETWRLNVARGFSDHVYKCMYADILERKDFLKFNRILEGL